MPVSIEEVIDYLREFMTQGKKIKKLGDRLLGVFEGAIPKGTTSTEMVRELRKPRYG
jgi:hypothetical protein